MNGWHLWLLVTLFKAIFVFICIVALSYENVSANFCDHLKRRVFLVNDDEWPQFCDKIWHLNLVIWYIGALFVLWPQIWICWRFASHNFNPNNCAYIAIVKSPQNAMILRQLTCRSTATWITPTATTYSIVFAYSKKKEWEYSKPSFIIFRLLFSWNFVPDQYWQYAKKKFQFWYNSIVH